MFEKFTRAGRTNEAEVIHLNQHADRLAEDIQPDTTAEDTELADWLELKSTLHEALLERLNLSVIEKVEKDVLRREVAGVVGGALSQTGRPLNTEDFNRIVEELLDEILGFGPLEPLLADPTINDILVNGYQTVYVERSGLLERVPVRFRDEKHLLRVIDKIVSKIGRRVDERQPWVDARLEDGSRVNAIIRPCSIDGPSVSIRKFAQSKLTMEKLVANGALNDAAARFLQSLVYARLNVLIAGGTGSGKTTMLNALSSYIDHGERVVTIEDAAELQLQQEHVVRLETRPPSPSGDGQVIQRDLVRNALRMRPDRIIVGEVRGAETFDMLQAMNTGHDGSMTTVHANSARDSLGRLEQMVTMTGIEFPAAAIRSQIASGLHFIVHLSRLADGSRRVTSISEITGMEGEIITMQDIFVFQKKGRAENGEVLGQFVPTGIRPKCYDLLTAAGVDLEPEIFRVSGG
ncbi:MULTISPECIES: CpaF family protein [unclassified Ruegeria]|uniref:CpaF family protein n=1 Tax=unclassified Ruegeria TaxID=2625375 RepID=UPI001490F8F9|nr:MULTISPECIES: CpaF family protein [unclassified Ruegeria]NOD48155.1 CpaF family protein [Ruegeria sp. HKCCD5849]NOD53516.1 CpaF family protein [Ruegeria sp. HKCCD5851]NOD70006.1 CpaF family protein [Ruegeria sp. HKCCD7303]